MRNTAHAIFKQPTERELAIKIANLQISPLCVSP